MFKVLSLTIASLIGFSTAALAAAGNREDNSSLVIWIFLGFCALIIVAQLVPAILAAKQAAKARQAELATGTAAEKTGHR